MLLLAVERETGIEPAPSAWKAEVLPLNYSRAEPLFMRCLCMDDDGGGGRWIRTTEGVSQQIYSLPPLAAWVSLRTLTISPVGPSFDRLATMFRLATILMLRRFVNR